MKNYPLTHLSSAAVLVLCSLLSGMTPATAQTGGFALADSPGKHLDVLSGGKIVGRYMYAHDTSTKESQHETYKPYCHVFDAEGKAPITKGAGGSFTHHRGIYIGWNKITVGGKTYDRWHMKGGDQIHEKFLAQSADEKSATFTSQVKWAGDGSDTIIEEERTMTFLPAAAPAYACVEMSSKLKAVAGDTKLDGDPEHAGLQFRPSDAVDLTQTTYVYPKENADAHKDRDYPWFGETFVLGGKSYCVVYLNHPSNPRNAPISAYRNYGRFGAFFPTSIPKDGSVTVRVRILVAEGAMLPAEAIQKVWNEFAGMSGPTPKITVKKAEQPALPKPKTPAK